MLVAFTRRVPTQLPPKLPAAGAATAGADAAEQEAAGGAAVGGAAQEAAEPNAPADPQQPVWSAPGSQPVTVQNISSLKGRDSSGFRPHYRGCVPFAGLGHPCTKCRFVMADPCGRHMHVVFRLCKRASTRRRGVLFLWFTADSQLLLLVPVVSR